MTELANSIAKNPDFVVTELVTRLSFNKTQILLQLSFSNKLCRDKPDFVTTELAANSIATKPDFFATEPVTRLSCNKTQILSQQSFSNKLCRDKPNLVVTNSRKTKFCRNKLCHDRVLATKRWAFFLSPENCCFGLFSSPLYPRTINTRFLGF